MPIIDPDREPDLTPYQRAESWLYMMWMDVYKKCIAMIKEEIINNGGLGGGAITITDVDENVVIDPADILVFPNGSLIQDGTDSSKAIYKPLGAAFWGMRGTLIDSVGDPGPVNLWGDCIITTIVFSADVDCTIEFSPGASYTFGAGGGTYTASGLSDNWDLGAQMTAIVTDLGEGGTYVNGTIGFQYA